MYRYYHNRETKVTVWEPPSEFQIVIALRLKEEEEAKKKLEAAKPQQPTATPAAAAAKKVYDPMAADDDDDDDVTGGPTATSGGADGAAAATGVDAVAATLIPTSANGVKIVVPTAPATKFIGRLPDQDPNVQISPADLFKRLLNDAGVPGSFWRFIIIIISFF